MKNLFFSPNVALFLIPALILPSQSALFYSGVHPSTLRPSNAGMEESKVRVQLETALNPAAGGSTDLTTGLEESEVVQRLESFGVRLRRTSSGLLLADGGLPETAWTMNEIRPEEAGPISMEPDAMPVAELLYPVDALPELKRTGVTPIVWLGFVKMIDHPVIIKAFQGNYLSGSDVEELQVAQVLGRLGAGPRFYGRVVLPDGRHGYAMEALPGKELRGAAPDHLIFGQEALIDQKLRSAGLLGGGSMVTPSGHLILMDAGGFHIFGDQWVLFIHRMNSAAAGLEETKEILRQGFGRATDRLTAEDLRSIRRTNPQRIAVTLRLYSRALVDSKGIPEEVAERVLLEMARQLINRGLLYSSPPPLVQKIASSAMDVESEADYLTRKLPDIEAEIRSYRAAADPDDPWAEAFRGLLQEEDRTQGRTDWVEAVDFAVQRAVEAFYPNRDDLGVAGKITWFRDRVKTAGIRELLRELTEMRAPFSPRGNSAYGRLFYEALMERLTHTHFKVEYSQPGAGDSQTWFVVLEDPKGSAAELAGKVTHEIVHQMLEETGGTQRFGTGGVSPADWVTQAAEELMRRAFAAHRGESTEPTGAPEAFGPTVRAWLHSSGRKIARTPTSAWPRQIIQNHMSLFPPEWVHYAAGHLVAGVGEEMGEEAVRIKPEEDRYQLSLSFVLSAFAQASEGRIHLNELGDAAKKFRTQHGLPEEYAAGGSTELTTGLEESPIKSSLEIYGQPLGGAEWLGPADLRFPESGGKRPISDEVLFKAIGRLPAVLRDHYISDSGLAYYRYKVSPRSVLPGEQGFSVARYLALKVREQSTGRSFVISEIQLSDIPRGSFLSLRDLWDMQFLPSEYFGMMKRAGIPVDGDIGPIVGKFADKETLIRQKLGALSPSISGEQIVLHEVGGILWMTLLPADMKDRWRRLYPFKNNPEEGPIYLRNRLSASEHASREKDPEKEFYEDAFSDKFSVFLLEPTTPVLAEVGWVLRPEERAYFNDVIAYFEDKVARGFKVHEIEPTTAAGLEEGSEVSVEVAEGMARANDFLGQVGSDPSVLFGAGLHDLTESFGESPAIQAFTRDGVRPLLLVLPDRLSLPGASLDSPALKLLVDPKYDRALREQLSFALTSGIVEITVDPGAARFVVGDRDFVQSQKGSRLVSGQAAFLQVDPSTVSSITQDFLALVAAYKPGAVLVVGTQTEHADAVVLFESA